MLPQNHRLPSLCPSLIGAALAAALLLPGAALADTDKVTITKVVTKQVFLSSNGSEYTQVPILGNLIADVRVEADAGVWGEIKEWKTWLKLRRETGAIMDFEGFAHQKVYAWSEHIKSVDREVQLAVPKSAWQLAAIDSCNRLADELRAGGMPDAQIFGQDRSVTYDLEAELSVDMSGPDGLALEQAAAPFPEEVEVVCQKWQGSAVPHAGAMTVQHPEVVNAGLSIVEKATINGACRIRLDAWVTTDLKNAKVDVRFENEEGKKSPVQTVDTGVSKTASFSRWEEVAGHPQGQVRIVGEGFASDWVDYDLDCVEGGPGTIVSNSPPLVSLSVVPHGQVMVRGYICPETVKLIGVLQGRGNFSGKAIFFGKNYFSPLRDYSITHGEKVLLGAEAEVNWDSTWSPDADTPMLQMPEFGLNVTNEENKVIASAPKRPYAVYCSKPALNPAVQAHPGGLVTGNRDPQQSGATVPRRLRVLPQATPPEPRRRLQRLRSN